MESHEERIERIYYYEFGVSHLSHVESHEERIESLYERYLVKYRTVYGISRREN